MLNYNLFVNKIKTVYKLVCSNIEGQAPSNEFQVRSLLNGTNGTVVCDIAPFFFFS